MAVSMLRELHTAVCLRHLQVDLQDKSVKLSFCPFCACIEGNDLSYLNHIIIAHYNASYGCGKCLKQAFISSSTLHNHKKVCIGFVAKKPLQALMPSPAAVEGAMATMAVLPGPPPRRTPRLQPQTPRATAPCLPCRHCHAAVDESHPTTTSPTSTRRTHQGTRRKRRRRRMQAPPGRAPATRRTRTVAATRPMSAPSTTVSPMSLYLANNIFHYKTHVSVMI